LEQQFPDTPTFTGYNTPVREEVDIENLEIIGTLPGDIRGKYYRCGPDPHFPPRLGDDIYINGDGMLGMFVISENQVSYKSRYVKTEKYLVEAKADKSLFGSYRNPYTDDESVAGMDRTTANTTVLYHAGKLFALKEDGLPYELDEDTLETLGRRDFGGKLKSLTVTAHPKLDPETGEWVFFGYEADSLASREVSYAVADREGNLIHEEWFTAPYAAMQHDFAVTRNHVIFMIFPTTTDIERMKKGGDHWVWQDNLDSWFGVMPRRGSTKNIKWIKYPAASSFHIANAYDDGASIIIDLCLSKRNGFPCIKNIDGKPFEMEEVMPFLTRLTIHPDDADGHIEATQLSPIPGELPMIDRRKNMSQHQHVYYGGITTEVPLSIAGPIGPGLNMLVSVDTSSGEIKTLFLGPNRTFQEPQIIPSDSNEGGYLMVVVDHHDTDDARLAILDAHAIENGPLAEVLVPHRLRSTFHGCWVPDGATIGV
jgi:carotenoid cleavage dioxygenase-like enzyme